MESHKHHHKTAHSDTHQNKQIHSQHAQDKHRHKNHFNSALLFIAALIAIVLLAFLSENRATGFAVREESVQLVQKVAELNDFKSLQSLSPGNYYVDNDGVVYWLDDGSLPVVAKVKNLEDSQRSRHIYIDENGNLGYVIR